MSHDPDAALNRPQSASDRALSAPKESPYVLRRNFSELAAESLAIAEEQFEASVETWPAYESGES